MLRRVDGDEHIFMTAIRHLTIINGHGLQSIRFFYTLKEVQADIPIVVMFAYALGNVVLQVLNWFWYACHRQLLLSDSLTVHI
jgi:hypothetical protein